MDQIDFTLTISKAEFLANPTLPELDNLIAVKIRKLKQQVTVAKLREAFVPVAQHVIEEIVPDGEA